MPMGILFWVLYIICFLFYLFAGYTQGQPWTYRHWGGGVAIFLLIGLLGWQAFGAIVK
jgi:hypothetical protein